MTYQDELTNYIQQKALKEEALLTGVTKIRRVEPVILFAFPFTEKWFLNVPLLSSKMLAKDYLRSRHVQDQVASILKGEGYTAHYKTVLSLFGDFRPLAVSAGMGEWGRNGIVVNKDYGAGLLFAALFTNAPLTPTKTENQPEGEHCISCGECIRSCPADAFYNNQFHLNRCIPYSIRGCAECLKVCKKKPTH
ncbi:4Fe-4S binding protein [Alkaliphilus hydrothermalis]|uniref:Epoxyqueuosine reductase n=1 Tax=Alkaliphilus hydrothermalis TaxID=1482730 RepID=A0ABS2NR86_9FIRM|nr:4Fe-4S binding protein [Alkaliphilus hydrothermalis]MBM7615468.1 epoxyqueuosine reductase [Alkaliphilus hydrothermalis]